MTSLFGYMASGQRSPENEATKALHYLLELSPAKSSLRAGFNRLLKKVAPSCPSITRFDVHTSMPDGGIPDMRGFDGNGAVRLLVESKFWAGFTDNQPDGYLSQLKTGGLLLFIIPDQRRNEVCRTLGRRLLAAGWIENSWIENSEHELQSRIIDSKRMLAATSWRAILKTLVDGASDELEQDKAQQALSDIGQLRGLCEVQGSHAGFLPLTGLQMSNQEMPRLIVMLTSLVEKTVDDGVNQGLFCLGARGRWRQLSLGREQHPRSGATLLVRFMVQTLVPLRRVPTMASNEIERARPCRAS